MLRYLFIGLLFLLFKCANAQSFSTRESNTTNKKIIDSTAINTWPSIGPRIISDDGKYVLYVVENQPVGMNTIEVVSTDGLWRRKMIDAELPFVFFSKDNRQVLIKVRDTLYFWYLGSDKIKVQRVSDYQCPSKRWLCYKVNGTDNALVVQDLFTGHEDIYKDVIAHWCDLSGSKLVLLVTDFNGGLPVKSLKYCDLKSGKVKGFWHGRDLIHSMPIDRLYFNATSSKLIFIVNESKDSLQITNSPRTVWVYRIGFEHANLSMSFGSLNNSDMQLDPSSVRFSKNDNWILYELAQQNSLRNPSKGIVNIWSYKDEVVQPEQKRRFHDNEASRVLVFANIVDSNLKQYIYEGERLLTYQFPGDYVVTSHIDSSLYVDKWNSSLIYQVVSLRDGSRRVLSKGTSNLSHFSISPDSRWIIYYDSRDGAFHSYDIVTGTQRNVTKAANSQFVSAYDDLNQLPEAGVVGWISPSQLFMLYDHYDIWLFDASGKREPVNVTNGIGRRMQTKLRLIEGPESTIFKEIYNPSESILMYAFNTTNKYNGFYRVKLGSNRDPDELIMGPYTFFRTNTQKIHSLEEPGVPPVKAANENVWIVTRQSATEAPNLYLTKDFKTFEAVTDLKPEKNYNWYSSELITWRQLDGTLCQGVLYKPENFDSTLKYPVIFNFYEKMSHTVFEYKRPEYSTDNINIPWFVSRGYLVFTPDIHFQSAKISGKTPGEWAFNSVVSAAQYLSKLRYVDSSKMGIQGHSFGGLQTGYIISHSRIFAAAVIAAGSTDPVSSYLSLSAVAASYEHAEKHRIWELGQGRFGATPWERPELYLNASVVLSANKITSPLLIMHNEQDNNIQMRQGIELYLSLRRLHKKVWLLQYDNGGHSVRDDDAKDYTIRMTQFFDHYLKEGLPPKWMTLGIPYRDKGLDTEYELDKSGQVP